MKKSFLSLLALLLVCMTSWADDAVTWTFSQGTNSATGATVTTENKVSASSYTLGTNLSITGTAAAGDQTLTKLQPGVAVGKTAPDNNTYVMFAMTPKKGVTFTPTKLAFNAARFGTSGGYIDTYVVCGDKKVQLTTALNPCRPSDGDASTPEYSAESFDLTDFIASGERVEVWFYIYNLAANKQIGLNNITLTGTFAGTAQTVPTYSMAVKLGMEGAGDVSCNPTGTTFDEGTPLTVKATENFGYHFIGWYDDAAQQVSTDNPYSFTLTANTSLTANYIKNTVYALNLNLQGGANSNLVQVSPAGNIVDGIHHYETGTDVKLTAVNNRILTFTNWEDNSTAQEREIKMDGDKNITASFSAADYIVGWDFYNESPSSSRQGDYMSATDNAGMLSMRQADGTTSTWLALGAARGMQNGKYCARIWRPLTDKWYFEFTCSSKDYSNLKLSAAIGDDYNAYSVVNAQYSTDGITYTTFGTYNLPARGWDSQEFALPAEAAGQDKLYIRFMPDYTSALTGVTSTNDGLSIAEVFLLADQNTISDHTAPVLMSSIPANGSTGVSATGSIILTFDEKIQLGTGNATFGGETIQPTISGKNAVFQYSGLDYNTTYTLNLPAGVITDRTGNVYAGTTLSFTTMERQQPEARLFDAVVAQDGTGDYTTVQSAIDAAPASRVKPWLIFVKKGRYNEHVDIPATKPFIHLIGQDRESTVILDNRLSGGPTAQSVNVGATVVVNSNDCYFDNITFENSYGYEKQDGPQALALNTIGDRTIFNRVGMLSYQDTWITPSSSNYRAYVKNSFIEGAVDFIYNSGNIYIDHTTLYINRLSGGYIVAPSHAKDVNWGYVFMNCTITAPAPASATSVWLGRPWHNFPKTVFINTRAEVTIPAEGWYPVMGGLPVLWADYNTTDANGNPLDLSNRRDSYYYLSNGDTIRGTAKNYLTADEAAQYTIKNVLSGDDNWQPTLKTEGVNAPTPIVSGSKMQWQAVPYAICYVITKDGEVAGFTTSTEYDYAAGHDWQVQAVSEFGSLSTAAVPTVANVISTAIAVSGTPAAVYSLAGHRCSHIQKGINLVRSQDGSTRKIIR